MILARLERALLFLTILLLPTQLGRHFWPPFAYVYSLPIDYLSPTIYFWDLLVVVLLFCFIAQRRAVNKIALNLWLLFMLMVMLSLLPITQAAINSGAGLVRVEQYLIAGLFGLYLASINLKERSRLILAALAISMLAESALAIGQFISGHTLGFWIFGERSFLVSTPAIAKFDYQGRQLLRPYATFPHPNVLAGFMVIILPILSVFYRLSQTKGGLLFYLAIALGSVAILLTVSRVALIVAFVLAISLLSRKILAGVLFLIGLLSPFLYTRFSAVFSFDNLTLLRREELGEVAVKLFSKSPLNGVGLNNFIVAASDQLLVGPSRFLQPVHNIFLLQLAETGILGLIGLLVLVYPAIKNLFKNRQKNRFAKPLLLGWLAIVLLGLFDHYFLTLAQGYRLLFFIWGISFGLAYSQDEITMS